MVFTREDAARAAQNIGIDFKKEASVNVAEERCRVIKPPDITRAKEIGSESVSIFVPSLNYR